MQPGPLTSSTAEPITQPGPPTTTPLSLASNSALVLLHLAQQLRPSVTDHAVFVCGDMLFSHLSIVHPMQLVCQAVCTESLFIPIMCVMTAV